MVSLFFGELYRASRPRRALLVLIGMLVALLCNIGRTICLATLAAKDGVEVIANWHDPLGYLLFATCLLLVWRLARLLAGPRPKLSFSEAPEPNPLPWRLTLSLGAWLMLTVISVEVWYRAHEERGKVGWSVAWPVSKKEFSDLPITELEANALACDEKTGAGWTNSDGSHWMAFFFKWGEGPARSRILARMHRPENCLPAAGYTLREDRGTLTVNAKNLRIPFRALNFEYGGDQVYVFFCLWEDRRKQPDQNRIQDEWTRFAKLESVFLGERNLGQQVFEVVISGYNKPEEAEAAFRRDIGAMIQI
jgi:exosortase/archaeosortase family protein